MPLDFPTSPSVNQTYTSGSNTWTWDGTAWNATSSVSVFTGATGPTGSVSGNYVLSLNGSTGNVGISAGTNITITPSGNTYTISAASSTPAGSTGYIQYYSAAGLSADDGLVYTSGNETLQIGSGSKPLLLYAVGAGGFVEVPGNAASILTISSGTNLDGTVNIGNSAGIGIVTNGSAQTVEIQGTVSFIDPTGVYTNTFPTGTGATGQVLTTQASGLMYWSTPSASSSNSTTQTIDFTQTVNGLFFTVTGITSSNDVYRFTNIVGNTAALRNVSGTVNITGKIYSSDTYWDGGITYGTGTGGSPLPNSRSVDIEMRSPFTQGATTYYAEDLTSLSILYLYDTNIYTRLLGSGVSGDGFSAGLSFGGGQTFSISGLTLMHNEGTDVVKTVTGLSWVTANSFITCKCLGLTNDDHEPEDAILEGVQFEVDNLIPGTGFDIIGHAPEGTYGKYTIKCFGQ